MALHGKGAIAAMQDKIQKNYKKERKRNICAWQNSKREQMRNEKHIPDTGLKQYLLMQNSSNLYLKCWGELIKM